MSEFVNTIELLGDEAVMDSIINRTITEFKDDSIEEIGAFSFCNCKELTVVDLSSVREVKNDAFNSCSALTTVNFPKAESVGHSAFYKCSSLKNVVLPEVISFDLGLSIFDYCASLEEVHTPKLNSNTFMYYPNAFSGCTALKLWDAGHLTSISSDGNVRILLNGCHSLETLIFRHNAVVPCGTTQISKCSLSVDGSGVRVFVPRALVSEYEAATNWCDRFAAGSCIFLPLEDYTLDGTTEGGLVRGCSDIQLSSAELILTDAETKTLTAMTIPANTIDKMIWLSSDISVADVKNGVITPVSDGTTIITAAIGTCQASCLVTIDAGLYITNILGEVAFHAGYIGNDGAISSGGTSDVYTDRFVVQHHSGKSIEIQLLDVTNDAKNSRICYFSQTGDCIGYTLATTADYGAVIKSTVPTDAAYGAVSINKSGGFSGILITCDGIYVGSIDYTT